MVIASNPYFYRSRNFYLHEEDDWQCSAPTAQNRRCRNSKSGYSASKYCNLKAQQPAERRKNIKLIILDRLCSRWHRGAMIEVPKLLDELATQYEHDHFPDSCQCCKLARQSQRRNEEAARQAALAQQHAVMADWQASSRNAPFSSNIPQPAAVPVIVAPPVVSYQQPAMQAPEMNFDDDVSVVSDTSTSNDYIEESSFVIDAGFDETEITDVGIAVSGDMITTHAVTDDCEPDTKPDVASTSASASTPELIPTPPTEAETPDVDDSLANAVAADQVAIAPASPAPAVEFISYTSPASLMELLQTDIPPQLVQTGTIYAFTWPGAPGHVRIAHVFDGNKTQLDQWQQCFSGLRELWKFPCRYPERMEKLVHLHLRDQRRAMMGCPNCTNEHSDWFAVAHGEAVAAMRLWANALDRAELYTMKGQLCLHWKDILRGAVEDEEVLSRLRKEVIQLKDGVAEPQVVLRYPQYDCKTWEGRVISLLQILGALWTLLQIVLR